MRSLLNRSTSSKICQQLTRKSHFQPRLESLEARHMLAADPIITEFMASNDNTLDDGNGNSSDWIEIYNDGDMAIDLDGWHLTDDALNLTKWTFPSTVLGAGEFLVVFASNDNVPDLDGNLHTNFKLSASGEYLALVEDDGTTIASEFSPTFPPQFTDVSYGSTMDTVVTPLVTVGSEVEVLVPTDGSLGDTWQQPGFVLGPEWITETSPGVPATSGVGFDTRILIPDSIAAWPLNDDVGSGSALDSVTGAHNGAISGTVTLGTTGVAPDSGTAATFANGVITVPHDAAINTDSFSLAVWAKVTGGVNTFRAVTSNRSDKTPDSEGFVLYAGSDNNWQFWTGNGNIDASNWDVLTGPAVVEDQWTYLVITYDAATDTKSLYVDGVATSVPSQNYVPNSLRNFHIGRGGDFGTDFPFVGDIDEVNLYDVALDAAQVDHLYTPIAPAATFYPITSITSPTAGTDLWTVNNLIQGPGVGFDAAPLHNALGTGSAFAWVTAAPTGFPSDYILDTGMPVLTIDLGADVLLQEISTWGYASTNGNGASEFSLRFATDAEGIANFGTSITFNPTFFPTNNDILRQSFNYTEAVTARYVEFTVVDNFFGAVIGGDRVGLGEIAFSDTPSTPPTPATSDFYTIVSVETPNSVEFFSKENLIQGPGVGFDAAAPYDSLGANSGTLWVTDAPNGAGDYYANGVPAPEIILDLGENVLLSEISIWGYATSNTNGIRDFDLEFATDAEGTGNFSTSIAAQNGFQTTTLDTTERQSFEFSEFVIARYVKMTVTDNQRDFHGGIPGGDRVGIGEIAFASNTNDGTNLFAPEINTDIETEMSNVNASSYIRIPFMVADVTLLDNLFLRMKYDDGFVAYLNGNEVASRNAPVSLTFDANATDPQADFLALIYEEIDITSELEHLVNGPNVLAIHGLNLAADDEDFLISAELEAVGITVNTLDIGFFNDPSPGSANSSTTSAALPAITNVSHSPNIPTVLDDLIVTAEITPGSESLSTVNLVYRVMYGAEVTVAMADDGLGSDSVATDGIYTGVIPAGVGNDGEMVRYYITAEDSETNLQRAPKIADITGQDRDPEYFGTVRVNTADDTNTAPVFRWFAQNPNAAHTRSGERVSVFYNGEFYDNVFARERGGATNSSVSQKFDFNNDHLFFINDTIGRVEEINLNGPGSDGSTSLRQTLAFDTHTVAGVPSSASFFMDMDINGSHDRTGIYIEQVDDLFLERFGLDPEGALYKFVQRQNLDPVFNDTITGIEKKTRLEEDFSDIQAVVDGLNQPDVADRKDYIFDNFNVPEVVNYLAVRAIIQDADDIRKNFYFYRDTNGSGEWEIYPWDNDFTFGILGDGGPNLPHPFFGEFEHLKFNANQWNVMIDVMFDLPETQEMYLRRLRTLMDDLMGPAGTSNSETFFSPQLDVIYEPVNIDPLDPHHDINDNRATVMNYFNQRRTDLFLTHSINNTAGTDVAGIPNEQVGNPQINFDTIVHNPISGIQDEEYIELNNPSLTDSVDISGWQLTGGVTFTFQPGTVIPAGGTLYVSPNVKTFRARATGPSGGQSLFVQGGYSGHISNLGETINLIADDTTQIDTVDTPFDPSDAQKFLRISEIMYNPSDPTLSEIGSGFTNNDDFEFVELVNISEGGTATTIDLSKLTFSEAFDFTFPASTLAAGERILVVRNQAAFTERYGSGHNIAGEYQGAANDALSNGGDHINLEDAQGSTIHDFSYEDGNGVGEEDWHPETDGNGPSLVMIDSGGDIAGWGDPLRWRASVADGGSPGALDKLDADFDSDGKVGLQDLLHLKKNFGVGTTVEDGDLTGDLQVNADDVAAFLSNYGAVYEIESITPPIPSAPAAAAAAASLVVSIDASTSESTTAPVALATASGVTAIDQVLISESSPAESSNREGQNHDRELRRTTVAQRTAAVDQAHATIVSTDLSRIRLGASENPLRRAQRRGRIRATEAIDLSEIV